MTVHSLRGAKPDSSRLVADRGLEGVTITHDTGVRTLARGLAAAFRWPHATRSLLTLVFRTCGAAPMHLAKSLFLVPRVLEVFARILRDKPTVVHASWAHYPSMVVHLVQRFMPDVVTSISFSAYDIHRRYPISSHVAKRADVVRTLSRFTARETAEAFGLDEHAIEVIHDSVDLSLLPPPAQRTPRLILTAGRLLRPKGMEQVLRTFAAVHREFPDAALRVLGSGPDEARLISLAVELGVSPNVTFAGHVPHTEVLAEMRRADVFLFLSRDERLPNVVKEAMICGCVCVVSRTPGIEELVEDGVSGYIVEQDDLISAARHIVTVFDGRAPTKHITEAASAHIREAFDLRVSVARYRRLWESRARDRRAHH